jgi:23S rRNA pseudouridine1911/1915/1917 synthase
VSPDPELDPELEDADGGSTLETLIAADDAGERLDKALAARWPELSRARLQALIAQGALTHDGAAVAAGASKTKAGLYRLHVPAPIAAEPAPEDIPLDVLYEDEHLIVVNKPAGMAAHPAPGSWRGTLVNALLHHCAGQLSGIGGVARPGIVHRLDKDTSGVMVAAKSDVAHAGLSALFAAHDIERAYIALARGAPSPSSGTIKARIGRSPHDRKKMAILRNEQASGREAITHYRTQRAFGPAERPLASRLLCKLETGRTHQIRVHLASKGCPCLGDAIYGSGPPAASVREAIAASGLNRQALHATILGFVHPVTGQALRFETPPPADMAALGALLATL